MSKGGLFTIDAIIAAPILLMLLVTSTYYLQTSLQGRWDDVVLVRTNYDLGLSLDRSGILATNNETLIEDTLDHLAQDNMLVGVKVWRYRYLSGQLSLMDMKEYGDTVDGEDFMTETFVSSDPYGWYYMVKVRVKRR
ncbi:hypothetical protein ACFLRF_01380 [Candidatus Altiarchaeota archaeon]